MAPDSLTPTPADGQQTGPQTPVVVVETAPAAPATAPETPASPPQTDSVQAAFETSKGQLVAAQSGVVTAFDQASKRIAQLTGEKQALQTELAESQGKLTGEQQRTARLQETLDDVGAYIAKANEAIQKARADSQQTPKTPIIATVEPALSKRLNRLRLIGKVCRIGGPVAAVVAGVFLAVAVSSLVMVAAATATPILAVPIASVPVAAYTSIISGLCSIGGLSLIVMEGCADKKRAHLERVSAKKADVLSAAPG
jgi:uncharacterized membrane-anchored protein YhcB (DUF1043 family)